MHRIIVYSNSDWAAKSDAEIEFRKIKELRSTGFSALLNVLYMTIFLKSRPVDQIFIINPFLRHMLPLALYRATGGKAQIIYYDLNLKKPGSLKSYYLSKIKAVMLGFADRIICMHKDIRDLQKYYKIDQRKVRYVAFKANNFESREQHCVRDAGYVLSCGVSHRDYDLLLNAASACQGEVRIICPSSLYQTYMKARTIPANVRLLKHEEVNIQAWYDLIAGAKFVVLPIEKDCIYPAGTSVYLEAMMLKKAVILSDGPSSNGLIGPDVALIVRRGDEFQLRRAIKRLYEDAEARSAFARNGYNFAKRLQGEERLIRDLKSELKLVYKIAEKQLQLSPRPSLNRL